MKLITQRDLIRKVADRYRTQYPEGSKKHPHQEEIYARLAALDKETATVEDIKAIIGVDGWASVRCDECGESVGDVIDFTKEHDEYSFCLCFTCVKMAAAMVPSSLTAIEYRFGVTCGKCGGNTAECGC